MARCELRSECRQEQTTLFPAGLHNGDVGPGLDLGVQKVHAHLFAGVALRGNLVKQLLKADHGGVEPLAQQGHIAGFEGSQGLFQSRQGLAGVLRVTDLGPTVAIRAVSDIVLLLFLQPLVA